MGTQQLAPGLAVPVYRSSSILPLSEVQDGMRDDGAASAPASPARRPAYASSAASSASPSSYPPTYPTDYVTETSRHQERDIAVLPPAPSPVRLAPKPQGRAAAAAYEDDDEDVPAVRRPVGRPPRAVNISDDDDVNDAGTDEERVPAPKSTARAAAPTTSSRVSTSPFARGAAAGKRGGKIAK